jgi:hypothetical protein
MTQMDLEMDVEFTVMPRPTVDRGMVEEAAKKLIS